MMMRLKHTVTLLPKMSRYYSASAGFLDWQAHIHGRPLESRSNYQGFGNASLQLVSRKSYPFNSIRCLSLTSALSNPIESQPTPSVDLPSLPTPAPSRPNVPSNLKWDVDTVADHVVRKLECTGALLNWADLNLIQKLLFPYTYSLMYYLDYMITVMPWWSAIMASNLAIRLVFTPVIIKHTAVSVRAYNLLPETQKFQHRINDALAAGNQQEVAIQRTKLKIFMEENDIKIKDRLWPILIQAPAFFSMFFLLRKLSDIPVSSMLTGGALWFSNLTAPDPLHILPVLTCISNFLLLEYGMPTKPAAMTPVMRWVLRGLSVGLFPIVYNFPTSVVIFWTTNNVLTLSTNLVLKMPKVRKKLGIPLSKDHDISLLPMSNQTFSGQVKNAVETSKASRTSQDIRRLDDIAFRKAGVGPLRKTYKEPPKKEA